MPITQYRSPSYWGPTQEQIEESHRRERAYVVENHPLKKRDIEHFWYVHTYDCKACEHWYMGSVKDPPCSIGKKIKHQFRSVWYHTYGKEY